eukprot:GHVN01093936.1.p1 GENE.GHVN01093936.1~~GHVN01093936.1.p1  ORF type:complete len:361 (+),score=47.46 GHVN01093936.1:34-1116(+)
MSATPSYSVCVDPEILPYRPTAISGHHQIHSGEAIDPRYVNSRSHASQTPSMGASSRTPQFSYYQTPSQTASYQIQQLPPQWQHHQPHPPFDGPNRPRTPQSDSAPSLSSRDPSNVTAAPSAVPEHHKKVMSRLEGSLRHIQRVRKNLDLLEAALRTQAKEMGDTTDALDECKRSRQVVENYLEQCETKLDVWTIESKDAKRRLMRLKGESLSDLTNQELEKLSEELSMGRQALIIEQSNRSGDERPKEKPKRVIEFFHDQLPANPVTVPRALAPNEPERMEALVKNVGAEMSGIQRNHADNMKEYRAKEKEFLDVKKKVKQLQETYRTRRSDLERIEKELNNSLKEVTGWCWISPIHLL